MAKEKEVVEEEFAAEDRIYEVSYLLVPTIPGEEVPAVYGDLKELIVSLGGEIISDEMPRQIDLAYTMAKVIQNIHNKFDSAYFGWFKFSMSPEKVLDLKKKMDLNNKIIRFLTIKTVKENTVATKKFVRSDATRRKTVKKEGEEVVLDKGELDKEIDAMVTA